MRKFKDAKPELMRLAIKKARQGIKKGQTPFGACIVRRGKVVALCHNGVWENTDITGHAEIQAIRLACRKLRRIDLSDCEIYSTCEPCPMCFSAIHWARLATIIYGTDIRDARKIGFNELALSNQKMKSEGRCRVKIIPHFLREESLELFRLWLQNPNRKAY